MELRTVEILSAEDVEPVVLRLRGGELPALVVPAEELRQLLDALRAAHEHITGLVGAEMALGLGRVVSDVGDWMKSLERASARGGVRLPFRQLETEQEWQDFKEQLNGLLSLLPPVSIRR